jgi:sirohydrochlorin ferrochelatase
VRHHREVRSDIYVEPEGVRAAAVLAAQLVDLLEAAEAAELPAAVWLASGYGLTEEYDRIRIVIGRAAGELAALAAALPAAAADVEAADREAQLRLRGASA